MPTPRNSITTNPEKVWLSGQLPGLLADKLQLHRGDLPNAMIAALSISGGACALCLRENRRIL
jgi:hypothetical protein